MTYSFNHLLISAGWPAAVSLKPAGAGLPLRHPQNNPSHERADSLAFVASFGQVHGAPTSWALKARLMLKQPHTTGYQRTRPHWFAADPALYGFAVVGAKSVVGDLITLWDSTSAPAVLSTVTIRTVEPFAFAGALLEFIPEASGGTSPGIAIALTLTEKGK